ncbi:MAG: polynucleotide adenylyltransferase [Verrucomicrobia bacterium]|nr:polynucleotide adenylyltransferase [Verrucomicrobiota bacterium]NBU09846.1 polynucleotide adenylyltransferase [Pseudomonadota bacterium]NDA66388.1 polynucleotide adenylyltransferase [Verrucomicrobiota bacterium]NDB75325.1 polynucleotide adenylyltransferase [Verrucomicrobiota bacterium]NDD38400.1 polynucleotide adenylyltransferase [Verrucomicrobiota bacterium]
MPLFVPSELARLLAETPELSRAFLVGGCVRDALLGLAVKDFDVEVFGVGYEALTKALRRWGRVDFVGQSFGVAKLTTGSGLAYDFAIPRRDRKVAQGHKGFAVEFDAGITPQEAASRRDFTINALMYDPRCGEVLDFFNGQADLRARVLRHTSDAFVEDPLRVLRGMQFAARFNLSVAPETIALCRSIKASFSELAVERVGDEWWKWAAKSTVPSVGLRFLADTEWLEHFPEVAALRGTVQNPEWHPEGDVFTHTAHCCDALVKLPEWQGAEEESRVAWMLAVLAHDFGKPAVTHEALRDGRMRIVSPGHEEGGVEPALRFLGRIHVPHAIRDRVPPLVANHLAHLQPVSDRAVRRLAKRLEPETIAGLCIIVTADHNGRPPKPPCVPEGVQRLLAKAEELRVKDSAPKPILQGRHLVAAGLKPGREFKALLHEAFEAQLEGKFADLDGAEAWLRRRLA